MKKNGTITIDVHDWLEETQKLEENATSLDELITLAVEKEMSTAQLARMHIIQRELGLVEEDVIPGNKQLLQNGGRIAINLAFARAKKEIVLKGKTYRVRELIASVPDNDHDPNEGESVFESVADGTDSYAESTWHPLGSERAMEQAGRYLLHCVPGHIMGRFLIIHSCSGKVKSYGDELKAVIDEMMQNFT